MSDKDHAIVVHCRRQECRNSIYAPTWEDMRSFQHLNGWAYHPEYGCYSCPDCLLEACRALGREHAKAASQDAVVREMAIGEMQEACPHESWEHGHCKDCFVDESRVANEKEGGAG